MATTLDDFLQPKRKEKIKAEHEQIKPEKLIALAPLEKIRLKQLVLKRKIKRNPEPHWWNEIPDSIPGCFGTYLLEPYCEKCRVKKMCKEQVRHAKK